MTIGFPALPVETQVPLEAVSVGNLVLTSVTAPEAPPDPMPLPGPAGAWADIEFGRAELGDARRTQRLIQLASQRGAQPHASIPQACGDKAKAKAAYRFYENKAISGHAILVSHHQATLDRLRSERIVLAVQDTTQLDYTAHPATSGLGVLNDADHQGLLVHTTLAVTPQRVPLGLLQQQVWARPAAELGKRHQRKQRPIQEKESQKWLTSLEATAQVQQQLPDTQVISVGDREADIYDLFLQAGKLSQDLLVRAAWDRGVAHPEGRLWAYLGSQPVAGIVTITVPRKPGQPARTADLTVRYAPVTLRPPRHRRKEHLRPIQLWAVLAREETPPPDTKAVEWLLLTTVPVHTLDDACERVQWYTCRWLIEVYHRVLKSGCRVEDRQFEEADRLQRYLALDSVIAWRVLFLTMRGRELPALPCTALLDAHEWQALYCFIHKTTTPPLEPPTLHQATHWIAQLGGFLDRTSDGEPGPTVLWRGLQRLNDLALAWQLFHPHAASP